MKKIVSEIVKRIDAMEDRTPILVAIDGSCTSGKSTLGVMLAQELNANLFRMDDYFLRPEQRTAERLSEIGGNVDYERFYTEVLCPLQEGKAFSYRPYDCSTGDLKAPVTVTPKHINIIEGSYSHHPYFGDPYDLKVFLKISPEIRLQRIENRPAFLKKGSWRCGFPWNSSILNVFLLKKRRIFQYGRKITDKMTRKWNSISGFLIFKRPATCAFPHCKEGEGEAEWGQF